MVVTSLKEKKIWTFKIWSWKMPFFFFEKAWLAKPPCKSEFFVIFVECWKTFCHFVPGDFNKTIITHGTQKRRKKILVTFRPLLPLFLTPRFFGLKKPKKSTKKWPSILVVSNGRKSTKIFFCVFWVQILLFFAFKSSETYFNQNGTQFTEFSSIFIKFYTTKIFYLFLVTF